VAEPQETSVVIPAYNEEEGIGAIVRGVLSKGPFREVIVVDDGSTDRTLSCAEAAGARVIRHPYNKGNGAAVKTGLREARGETVLLLDADGQHDPSEMAQVLGPIGAYDMVIGSRSASDQSPVRALGNLVFQALASWLTGRRIPDLTSGFRAAKRQPMLEILHLLPNGFSYPTTSCLAFLKSGLSVGFVPVKARKRVGKSKIRLVRDGVRFLLIILKIVTLYQPLKVFVPISALSFLLGAAYGLLNVVRFHKIPTGAAILIQLAVLVFLVGLVSEQIASAQERR
jgi:glycosyltransferase involved in cell wall biosynthesis